ncbi:right-handed parallel beta-helix repeat-containing protein [Streptomyces sp. CAU 1734]|uniref:right-handed parallel beta-helix repeat-containing protein n=1 Tax=Streptomyces sp. CAU 1734 TaxID=3140360 RepID=UPI00326197C1
MTERQKPYKRQIGCVVGVAVAMVSGLGVTAAPSSAVAEGHTVRPGESIQAAVDAARPGDTIVIRPGVYQESVLITTPDLTLRGSGPDTVLTPGPAPAAARAEHSCARAGNGICVTGTADSVTDRVDIRSLTLRGFRQNGLWASHTDRLTVRGVTAEENGVWGLSQEHSTRAVLRSNTARDNGDAGIFLANTVGEEGGATDTGGALISENTLTGNRVGINLKRVRNLTARNNSISGNCAGIFIVSDESKPAAGALSLTGNTILENNKLCPASPRLPAIQGSGIVLTGSDSAVIRGNTVRGNVGTAPMSGGIVLFESFVGATNSGNVIEHNEVSGNSRADLIHREKGGTENTFRGNTCESSEPAGLC